MKKNIIVNGLISGTLVTLFMLISMYVCYNSTNFESSMLVGYASMLLAFSLVFVGIKNQRDKLGDGTITFGKAFKTGFFISLIASSMYVFGWMIEYHLFIPDFIDKYGAHILKEARESGLNAAQIQEKADQIEMNRTLYANPFSFILVTYMEILPVGILVTLLCSLILKRKAKPVESL